tara:strand:- start:2198 stop:2428 length:231 start_codon:yes stop_codon:yes gene_type:complete
MSKTKDTHATRLIAYLKEYGSITSLDAFKELGNTRLAATIFILKDQGYKFDTENISVPTRWNDSATVAKYTINAGK